MNLTTYNTNALLLMYGCLYVTTSFTFVLLIYLLIDWFSLYITGLVALLVICSHLIIKLDEENQRRHDAVIECFN